MVTAHLVASTLASLTWLLRHAPLAREEQAATLSHLASLIGGVDRLVLLAGLESLHINDTLVPIEAPGAHLLNEHLLMQGIRRVEFTAPIEAERVVGLCAVLAAYPGTFESFSEVEIAAGAGEWLSLAEAPSELTFERESPSSVLLPDPDAKAPIEHEDFVLRADEGGLLHYPELEELTELEALDRERMERLSDPLVGAPPPDSFGHRLAEIVERGRNAGRAGDWQGLLEAALELLEIEAESATETYGKSIRLELRRMLPRPHLAQIARLASQGGHKQDALAILRKLGADATEVLMDLLVEAMSLSERRGYYSALTHMPEGHEVIIAHLRHDTWYVVRNAAELCGEMDLERSVPDLAHQAGHADERVRRSVAGALGKIGSPQALEPLRQLMADPVAAVRLRAVGSLNPRRARSLVPPLVALLGKESQAEVIRETAAALGRIGSPEALRALVEFALPSHRLLGMGGRPAEQRLWAVEGLALAGLAGASSLRTLSREGDAPIQAAAQAALQEAGGAAG